MERIGDRARVVPQLDTARLILRPLELADAGQIQRLFPHWEIVKHLAAVVPWPYPPDGALTYIRDVALPAIARGEEGHWTRRLKTAPDERIGCIGLKNSSHDRERKMQRSRQRGRVALAQSREILHHQLEAFGERSLEADGKAGVEAV